MKDRLLLASRSPRRIELLRQLGLDFDVLPSDTEEYPVDGESPERHVLRLAEEKAMNVADRQPGRWIVAADTVVCFDSLILGKPKTRDEALEMLTWLSGREHSVFTGFSVCRGGKRTLERQAVKTSVRVKPLSRPEIEWYIGTGEPFDKAGAYAIQGIGAFMIESIHGSYTNVVGLPVCELIQMMTRLGAISISDCGFRINQ
jgi:septum formation protein